MEVKSDKISNSYEIIENQVDLKEIKPYSQRKKSNKKKISLVGHGTGVFSLIGLKCAKIDTAIGLNN